MKLKGGVEYVARLETGLTHGEVVDRLAQLETPQIKCSKNIVERLKDPKIGVRDVYEKVVYDTVRRGNRNDKAMLLGTAIFITHRIQQSS